MSLSARCFCLYRLIFVLPTTLTVGFITSILQVRKPRLGDVRRLAQGRTASPGACNPEEPRVAESKYTEGSYPTSPRSNEEEFIRAFVQVCSGPCPWGLGWDHGDQQAAGGPAFQALGVPRGRPRLRNQNPGDAFGCPDQIWVGPPVQPGVDKRFLYDRAGRGRPCVPVLGPSLPC